MKSQFEVLPLAPAVDEAAKLTEPVPLTVTCSPTHGLDRTVEFAGRLAALGHSVTVHLAARMVEDHAHLDRVLTTMAETGVEDVFVIGGDASPPVGPYSSAGEVLSLVAGHPHRPRSIGVAGYPESHPLIDDATLARVLREKSRLADYVTTQLCFDPNALLAWVRGIRDSGIELPVLAGVPGIVDRTKLLEISMRVGVGPSVSFLRKQGGLRGIMRLSGGSADLLYDGLASYMGDPTLNIAGFHFYTFNRLVDTWSWVREKRAAEVSPAEVN